MNNSINATDSPRQIWKATRLLFFAIIAGASAFMVVTIIVNAWKGALMPEWIQYRSWFLIGLAVATFVVLLAARNSFKKSIMRARQFEISLPEKLMHYRKGIAKYLAFSELIVFAGAALFMYTGDFTYLAFAAIIIGFMLSNIPRKNRIGELLQPDSLQLSQLDV